MIISGQKTQEITVSIPFYDKDYAEDSLTEQARDLALKRVCKYLGVGMQVFNRQYQLDFENKYIEKIVLRPTEKYPDERTIFKRKISPPEWGKPSMTDDDKRVALQKIGEGSNPLNMYRLAHQHNIIEKDFDKELQSKVYSQILKTKTNEQDN